MNCYDRLERQEILEMDDPHWFGLCSFCGEPEGEGHAADCLWVEVRTQHNLEVKAA